MYKFSIFLYHCLLDLISKSLEFWLLIYSAQICQLRFLLGMNTHSFPTTSCFNSNLPIFNLGDVPANSQMSGLVWLLVGTLPFLCLLDPITPVSFVFKIHSPSFLVSQNSQSWYQSHILHEVEKQMKLLEATVPLDSETCELNDKLSVPQSPI